MRWNTNEWFKDIDIKSHFDYFIKFLFGFSKDST